MQHWQPQQFPVSGELKQCIFDISYFYTYVVPKEERRSGGAPLMPVEAAHTAFVCECAEKMLSQ